METSKHRNVTKSKINFRSESWKAMGHHRKYAENFSCCGDVFYNSGREKLYKKNIC